MKLISKTHTVKLKTADKSHEERGTEFATGIKSHAGVCFHNIHEHLAVTFFQQKLLSTTSKITKSQMQRCSPRKPITISVLQRLQSVVQTKRGRINGSVRCVQKLA